MANNEEAVETNVKEKIEYIGLNFERVPKSLISTEKLNFKAIRGYDERQYKQYRFLKVSDIDILLTPKNRLNSIREKYEEAAPLYQYLDSVNEENAMRYVTFLNMLKKVEISEIEAVASEQKLLKEELPYKVKFNGNYLWQIYYSEVSKRFFMLVPTEDTDYSTFFYLLKRKIENKPNDMVFVPISYLEYSGNILKKSEIKDLENYLWLFTKDYPAIYEVYNAEGKESLQIVGETSIYGKIKTLYKMNFETSKEATKFFKLLKALFILQLEIPHYYMFETKINSEGQLEMYYEGKKIDYTNLLEFVTKQYQRCTEIQQKTDDEIELLNNKLATLKRETTKLEQEYLEKEKMISTFLECKKSFFGKVKYYFTYGKKNKKISKKESKNSKEEIEEIEEITENSNNHNNTKAKAVKRSYTLDELIVAYKELEMSENNKKNIVQDINALKLKNKNLTKKIDNATLYINEINEHKKSIFEFWKYSNKDEVAALEEGEEEEVNVTKIEKTFDFDNDFEAFGQNADKIQRLKFTDAELESSYIASTHLLPIMNDIYNKKALELKDFSKLVSELKKEKVESLEEQGDEYEIFGNLSRNDKKESSLGTNTHREAHRDAYEILEIQESTKAQDLKRTLVSIIKNIKRALKKNSLEEDIYAYIILNEKANFSLNGLQLFSLNEEQLLKDYLEKNGIEEDIFLYRFKLPKGTNYIAMSNIVYYNNKNMTLPVGMQVSDKILIDMVSIKLEEVDQMDLNIEFIEDEKDDFTPPIVKQIEILEYE